MSDKDNNIFYHFQNFYPYLNYFNTEPTKCVMCSQPILHNIYSSMQLICYQCLMKYYNQIPQEPIVHHSPPVSTPSKPPAPKIHPPQAFSYPQNLIHSMIFICDFVSHFSDLIKVDSFSLEQLYQSLSSLEITELCRELCKSLVLKLAENVFRPDSEFKIIPKYRIFYMGSTLFEILDIRKYLNSVWVNLLGELIKGKCYSEYIKGTPIEKVKKSFGDSLILENFCEFTLEEKVSVIEFLINSFLDSKECREIISEKIEHQVNLTKIRYEKKQRLKQIESELLSTAAINEELEKEKQELKGEEQKIHEELLNVYYRTLPLGYDVQNNEYYFFKFEADKILVLYPSQNPTTEIGTWYNYKTKESIKILTSELIQQQKKELKLKESINKLMNTNSILDPIETSDYKNTKNENSIVQVDIEEVKEKIRGIEKSFSKYLKSTKKRWDTDPNEKKWKAGMNSTSELKEVCDLLIEFSDKALTPLRSQVMPNQKKNKYRKVILKLWQNCTEACNAWTSYIKTCQSKEELMVGVEVYQQVIDAYISRKKEEFTKHSDECYKCKDGGKLIMCENCPRVAHLKCAGLVKIPKGEWLCEHCK